MASSNPSGINPADVSSLSAAIDLALHCFSMKLENCLPAIVEEYDREKNIATIKPLIQITRLADDKVFSRNTLTKIPVISFGAGLFHISFPINKGDLGWIFAADRSIGNFLKELKEAPALDTNFHAFSNGIFIPDIFRQYKINPEDAGAMVIQSTDGATRISIRSDNIKVTAPVKVELDTPATHITGDVVIDKTLTVKQATELQTTLTVTQAATLNSTLTVAQAATVGGPLAANGGFTAAGGQPATLPAGTTVAGKALDTHTHVSGNKGEQTGPMQ